MTEAKNKYHSRKITRDGETFDSVKEYRRWCELKMLERAGTITGLRRQVKYTLLPGQYEEYPRFSEKTGNRLVNGRRCIEREVTYIADFVYAQDGDVVVEDTKGVKTKDYILKRKMMLYFKGIKIKEI